ncbi:redoxin domain-containing protein [Draconibacterium sp. IB214405]|uniref:redoxin domain-containing protein n=1 Tax=Draconibacterium sp. IB214405 TaxID=3097352 RepID=UPI002A10A95B|nr:redoxin domain-containing protein [Draconibacterium sp. IB214405]MDX8339161.1 redoxin domain-containing protein [Draconibacterium sp. IB214405]
MKKLAIILVILLGVNLAYAGDGKQLAIGDKAVHTDVKMKDVSGAELSLSDAKLENGLLVMFSCNTCPFVVAWEDRFNEVKEWADENEVGMIVLNSNYQKRDGADSFEEMQKKAEAEDYKFNYVVDKESKIANAFGGQTTPHVFLFDGDMKLAYKGAIDDNYKDAEGVTQAYLKEALISLGNDDQIAITETKPVGCGIKRKVD